MSWEHLVVPANKEMLKKKKMVEVISKGHMLQLKELPMAKDGTA